MVTVVVVVGTRPEAIKLFPVVAALAQHPGFEPFVISTGQHAALVDAVFAATGLAVDVNLGVGRPGLVLNDLSAATIAGVERVLTERFGPAPMSVGGHFGALSARGFGPLGFATRESEGNPASSATDGMTRVVPVVSRRADWQNQPTAPQPTGRSAPQPTDAVSYPVVGLVHGDTSSAVAGALALFHNRIPVAHVEAGLRTFDTQSPFPEELNRQLISRIASLHFAPTAANLQNLVREGIDIGQIQITGNTGIDAFLWAAAQKTPYGRPELEWLEHHDKTPVVTITAHRRENWGAGITNIATAVKQLAQSHPHYKFVWPVHPNPVVSQIVHNILQNQPNVTRTEPLDYLPFARLLGRSKLVITDSGGIQEEAPTLGVPVLVARDTTERGEGVAAGTLKLVGTDTATIVKEADRLLSDQHAYKAMASKTNPYGDGHAAQRIVAALADLAQHSPTPQAFGPAYNRTAVLNHVRLTDSLINKEA